MARRDWSFSVLECEFYFSFNFWLQMNPVNLHIGERHTNRWRKGIQYFLLFFANSHRGYHSKGLKESNVRLQELKESVFHCWKKRWILKKEQKKKKKHLRILP
jgi:hypothetical protein